MDKILLIDKPPGWTSFDVVAKIRGILKAQIGNERLANNNELPISNDPMIYGHKLSRLDAEQGSYASKSGTGVSHSDAVQGNNENRTSRTDGTSSEARSVLDAAMRRESEDGGSGSASQQSQTMRKIRVRVGHAGTLDPFATGLLIILLGDATKRADEFLKLDKTYEFTAKLGEISATGDPEGIITPYIINKQLANNNELPIDEIEATLAQFVGVIRQTPPAYSAIKINGTRAYKLAREGKKVDIPARKVTIHRLELLEYEHPYLKCVCDVSSGTYIRSLVEDIGKALNTGAYCTELRRTRIGTYGVKDAVSIDRIQ